MRTVAFIGLVALAAQTAQAQDTQPQTISLEQAIGVAKEKQPSLALARSQVEITEARTEQIKVARNPTLDLSAVAGLQPPRFGDTVQLLNPGWSGSLDLRWLLYDFGKINAQVKAAESTTIATQKDIDTLTAQIEFGVAQSYYDLWVAQESLVLTEEALSKVKSRVETAQALFDAGARPKIEVARAKLDQANAEVDKARAQGEIKSAQTALAAAMGLFGVRYSATQPINLSAPPPMPEAIERAYQARPEIAALEAQRDAQELQIKAARFIRKPSLIGQASASLLGPVNIKDTFIPLIPSYSAQIVFSMPLYDGGESATQIALLQAELRAIDAQIDSIKLDVSRSIEDAYTAYQTAIAARVATEEATKFAIENESLAKGRYDAGAGSAIEISDAEVALVQAKTVELQARAAEGLARLQIEFVLGVLSAK